MKITLYAICKNEKKNIEKFIQNSSRFSHVVVVDTGSIDGTPELLRQHGIEVYEHSQLKNEFDFSIARNIALSYVKTDWAFSLDFNEEIDNFFPESLQAIEKEFTAFKHLRFDDDGEGDPRQSFEVHTRLHRTKNYKWVNAVHEIPVFIPTEDHDNEMVADTTIKITKNIVKSVSKQLFYLSICEREHLKNPQNWYYIWFIFNHYFNVGNYQKALEYGYLFLDTSKPYFDQFRVLAFIRCSICLMKENNFSKAANYAFHALSEAMNMGEPYLSQAFINLNEIGKILNNPSIIVFATGFNEQTLKSTARQEAIRHLYESYNPI